MNQTEAKPVHNIVALKTETVTCSFSNPIYTSGNTTKGKSGNSLICRWFYPETINKKTKPKWQVF